jgi:HEAT repeat protein
MLWDDAESVRNTAMWALLDLHREIVASEDLRRVVGDALVEIVSEDDLRPFALSLIEELRYAPAASSVRRLLEHHDGRVRVAAAETLVILGDSAAVSAIERAAALEPKRSRRRRLERSVESLREHRTVA